MQLLGDRIEEEEVAPVVEVDFSPGDLVRVVAGPFENMTAEVEEQHLPEASSRSRSICLVAQQQ